MPLMASGILYFYLMRSTVFQSSAAWKSRPCTRRRPGGDVALGEIALAPAVMGGVDGEAKRGIAVLDRALDVIVGPGGVAAHIELEHAQAVGRGLGDVFEAGVADRAQHMGDSRIRPPP